MANTNNNKDKGKNPGPKYNEKQQKAVNDTVRAIKEYYGEKATPQVINSILGNVAVETNNFTKLREQAWNWKNVQQYKDNDDYKSINKNIAKWGGSEDDYNKLSQAERLSVMYYGDTKHGDVAGGTGTLHLTSANYGGNQESYQDLQKATEELGLNISDFAKDFYKSTLATLKVLDNRGHDLTAYESPIDLRKNVVNPHEDLKPTDNRVSILNEYDLSRATSKGASSINPDDIVNNPNLDDGTKEELLRINSSEGLEPETMQSIQASNSLLGQYSNGYTGFTDLNQFLVNNDQAKKQQKVAEAERQAQGPVNQGQQALGYTGSIGAFDPEFNLLNQEFNKGGNLHSGVAQNTVTEYNTGGSHEENPNGGIPVGPNSRGGQNLVEQGETRHGDYIYSNEFKLSKEDAERFNLNSKYVGKSYSDISRDINDEIKTRPHDRLVKKTAEGNLNKLMMAQETVRQQETADSNPDQKFLFGGMAETVAGSVNQINEAGGASNWLAQNGKQSTGVTGAGIAGAAGTLLTAGNQMFGDTGIETNGSAGKMQKHNTAMGALSGAASGAAAGASFGPIGMGVGAVVGGLGGLIGGGRKNKAIDEANHNAALVENNKFRTDDVIAKKGGLLDTYLEHGGPHDSPGKRKSAGRRTLEAMERRWDQIPDTNWDEVLPDVNFPENFNIGDDRRTAAERLIGAISGRLNSTFGGDNEGNLVTIGGNSKPLPKPATEPEPVKEPVVPGTYADGPAYAGIRNIFNYSDPGRVVPAEEEPFRRSGRPVGYQSAPEKKETVTETTTQPEASETEVASRPKIELASTLTQPAVSLMETSIPTTLTGEALDPEIARLRGLSMVQSSEDKNTGGGKGFQANELLRYAPLAGNLAQLLMPQEAETETYDRLDNRYKPDYVDEMAMQNIVSQGAANTRSAIQQMSGGSQAAARASLLGSQVNETRALSDAYMQMDNINRQQNEKAQQFNLGVDQYNNNLSVQETIANAQNRAAVKAHKQDLLQNVLNSAGEIGRENKYGRTLVNMTGYNPDGTKAYERGGMLDGFLTKKKKDPADDLIEQMLASRNNY